MAAPATKYLPTEVLHRHVLLAQKGSAAARALVVREVTGMVEYHVRRAQRPRHEAEDLRQEAMVGLLWAIDHWSPRHGTKFLSWATLCVLGYMKNTARKAVKTKLHLVEEFEEDVGYDGRGEEASLENPDWQRRELQRLLALVEQVPIERHRQIVTGRLLGYTLTEIADEAGVAAQNVGIHERRAWRTFLCVARPDLDGVARDELAEELMQQVRQ